MSLDSTHQFNIPTPARVGEIFKNPSPIDRSIGGDGDDGGLIDPFFILPLPSSPQQNKPIGQLGILVG